MACYNVYAEMVGRKFHRRVVSVVICFHIGQRAVVLLTEHLRVLIAARDFYDHVALGLNGTAALRELDIIRLFDLLVAVDLDRFQLRVVRDLGHARGRLGLCRHLDAGGFLFGVAGRRNQLLLLDHQTAVPAVNARCFARSGRGRLDGGVVDLPVTVSPAEIGLAALTAVLAAGQRIALLGAGGIDLLGCPLVTRRGKDRTVAEILVSAFAQVDHQSVRRTGGRNRCGGNVDMRERIGRIMVELNRLSGSAAARYGIGVLLIVILLLNLCFQRGRRVDIHLAARVSEGLIADLLDAGGNMDVGKACFEERLRADLFQRIRQADKMDRLAVHECAVADLGHAVGDFYRGDTENILHTSQTAAVERVILDFCQLAHRHHAVDERLMIIERVGVDGGDGGRQIDNALVESCKYNAVFVGIRFAAVNRIHVVLGCLLRVKDAVLELEIFVLGADVDRLQRGAVHEHPARDIPHIRGDGQLGHGFVVLEVTAILVIGIGVSENAVVVQEHNGLAVDLIRDGDLFIFARVVGDPDFIKALIGFFVVI